MSTPTKDGYPDSFKPIHKALRNIADHGGFREEPADDLTFMAYIDDSGQYQAMVANVVADRADFEIMRMMGQSLATLEYMAPFDPLAHREFIRRREIAEA